MVGEFVALCISDRQSEGSIGERHSLSYFAAFGETIGDLVSIGEEQVALPACLREMVVCCMHEA